LTDTVRRLGPDSETVKVADVPTPSVAAASPTDAAGGGPSSSRIVPAAWPP
jgi:hypothetical protein